MSQETTQVVVVPPEVVRVNVTVNPTEVTVNQSETSTVVSTNTTPSALPSDEAYGIAGETIPPFSVVTRHGDGTFHLASAAVHTDAERVVGLAAGAGVPGQPLVVRTFGEVHVPTPLPTPGPVYVGVDGALTYSPNEGVYELSVGYALTVHTVFVRLGLPIFH